MADIQIKKTAEEPGAASLAVTVPAEHVREAEERATTAYQRRARLPGFRKGKAPTAIVRKQFAVKPIADPHIHNLKWPGGAETDAPVTFEFHVEVKPDLKLERLGGFRLKRTVQPVTEEQVTAQLNELRAQRAPWLPIEGEAPKLQDLVSVTIATRAGDEAKDPQSYQLVLGEGRAIPEVEERILGLTPGQTLDTTVRFPQDFPEEAKRGQTRDIRITLHEVKRQQLPELDDAFAREVGDFESLEALRRAVRDDLERDAQREADARVRAELIEQIVAANRIAAPRPLVERALYVYAQAYGIPEGRVQQFAAEFRPVAEAQVRRDLILDYVTEREQLQASEAELERRLQELAQRRNMAATELRASLEKAKRLRDVERSITEEKVFAYLLSQSTVEQP